MCLRYYRLQEETAKVEQFLLSSSFSTALVSCFTNPDVSPDAFENFLDPLQKLLRLSPPVASTLAHPDLFSRTAQKLNAKKPVVRLNLLRVIRSICDACEEQGGASLIRTYGLYETIDHLAELDQAVLVRNLSAEMIKACELSSRRSVESTRVRAIGRRSSSTSTMTPPSFIHSQSIQAPTSTHLRSAISSGPTSSFLDSTASGIFDSSRSSRLSNVNGISMTPSSSSSSLFRPRSRDSNSGDGTIGSFLSNNGAASSAKSRLPRGNGGSRVTRMSLANQRKEENATPTHTPTSTLGVAAGTRAVGANSGSGGGVLAAARRRRQTSSETSSSRFAS
jgi:hypothetical protein